MAALKYIDNRLAVSYTWLIANEVMTATNYKQLKFRGDIQVLSRGGNGSRAMVAYDSMPDRFKDRIMELIPDPYETARTNVLLRYMEHDAGLSGWLERYETPDGRRLPMAARAQYYANGCAMRAIERLLRERTEKSRTRCGRAVKSWAGIAEMTQQLDSDEWPVKLPTNERSLQRLYNRWKEEGDEALIHKNYKMETSNSAKVDDEMKRSLLLRLISDPRNFDDARVAREYNMMAAAMGWKEITDATVYDWRQRHDIIVAARRHGGNHFANAKVMQVKRERPTGSMLMWCADGWDVEMLYQRWDGRRTTYCNRLTLVAVIDTYCNYPIGYAIGDHETPALITDALREAVRHTEELFGRKMQAYQFQCDNYAIKTMKPLYKQVAKHVTPARVGNAKAKVIERWFGHFNEKYCHGELNWSGYGVTAKKLHQPNVDYLNKNHANLPTYEELVERLRGMIEAERAELREQYVAGFAQTPDERKLPMSEEQYLLYFGRQTAQKVLLWGNGLTVTIDGQRRQYDCYDVNFRRHNTTRWTVLYDPADPSRALAVDDDARLQYLLEEKQTVHMALADRTEADTAELQRIKNYNKELREMVASEVCRIDEDVDDLLRQNRDYLTNSKLLLTDSDGQHKDRRNDGRITQRAQRAQKAQSEQPDMFDEKSIYDEY